MSSDEDDGLSGEHRLSVSAQDAERQHDGVTLSLADGQEGLQTEGRGLPIPACGRHHSVHGRPDAHTRVEGCPDLQTEPLSWTLCACAMFL